MNFEREEQRYEYALNAGSVVLDVGAFHGRWSQEIFRRYGCTIHAFEPVFIHESREALSDLSEKVFLYHVALSNRSRELMFGVQNDTTGVFSPSETRFYVPSTSIVDFWQKFGLNEVDLVKFNVEGMEVELIDALCDSGLIDKIRHLQVQFHATIPDCVNEIARIQARLAETHTVEWGEAPFLWTSYVRASKFKSYSQAGQDIFVHRVMGEKPGRFIDIGSSDPVELSNTYGLERVGWRGVMIDSNHHWREKAATYRKSRFYIGDATNLVWSDVIGNGEIDYLSLDIDESTLRCLQSIPLDKVKFKVITIEHDSYRFGENYATAMRSILSGAGYILIAKNVTLLGGPFEDWWVAPDLEDAASWAKSENKDWQEIIK